MKTSHSFVEDERNKSVLVHVNGRIVPRRDAVISVFDATLILGDGIWESFRFEHGHPVFLEEHLDRLFQGLRALEIDPGVGRAELTDSIYDLAEANGMHDGVHVRVIVTRGEKSAPSPDPRMSAGGPNLIIIAEYRQPDPEVKRNGIAVATVSTRAPVPDALDVRLNSSSRLPIVVASLEAARSGADEALMLDPAGFVASCSSTNFFVVRRGQLWTSTSSFCFNGITRRHVIELARASGITVAEKSFSLVETYDADEAFVTGSISGITPVARIDGHVIGAGAPGPLTGRLNDLYAELLAARAAGT